jgi:hypothetical protein
MEAFFQVRVSLSTSAWLDPDRSINSWHNEYDLKISLLTTISKLLKKYQLNFRIIHVRFYHCLKYSVIKDVMNMLYGLAIYNIIQNFIDNIPDSTYDIHL